MVVLVGLGNPDKEYNNTYHNVGYMCLDQFAKSNGIEFTKNKYNSFYGEGVINGEKVVCIKPTTYMNLSGKAVRDVMKSLKIDLSNILVIYDDIDLPCGTVRTRNNGSAGTHNGMRNIVLEVGSTEFARLRVGTGKPQFGNLADFVLSKIKPNDMEAISKNFESMNNEILYFIKNKKLEEKTIK